jgi:hypothetical protein
MHEGGGGPTNLLGVPVPLDMRVCEPDIITIVLDLVSQVRDVVLMNVYLDLGSGFWNEGYMSKGREMGRSVYEQPGNEVD